MWITTSQPCLFMTHILCTHVVWLPLCSRQIQRCHFHGPDSLCTCACNSGTCKPNQPILFLYKSTCGYDTGTSPLLQSFRPSSFTQILWRCVHKRAWKRVPKPFFHDLRYHSPAPLRWTHDRAGPWCEFVYFFTEPAWHKWVCTWVQEHPEELIP